METVYCKKCVLHSQVPGITIHEDGVCSVCHEQDLAGHVAARIRSHFRYKLKKEIEQVKAGSYSFDTLILFSGGKDSGYLLKLVKEEFGLRPLAFSVVHPLVNDTAAKNMETLTQTLGIPLFKFYPATEEYQKILRHALVEGHLKLQDEYMGCRACSYIFKNAALITAIRMGIPLVFDGTDKAQNETPVYIDGKKMKADALRGMRPFDPMHEIVEEGLGDEYRNSLYGFDTGALASYDFPSYISPFTFLDYDYKNDFQVLDDLGVPSRQFQTVFTNCDAVPFFSYFSLKRYNCLTYIRHYANEIRKNVPYFSQSKLEHTETDGALPRDIILRLLEEYSAAIRYVAEHQSLTEADWKRLFGMAPCHHQIYGDEVCGLFLEQVLKIPKHAGFFGIDLDRI